MNEDIPFDADADEDNKVLFEKQLGEAISDWIAGEGEAIEVASLAGLLLREGVSESPNLEMAAYFKEQLSFAIEDFEVAELVDALSNSGETDFEMESIDVLLFKLDEVGAAAMFLGRTAEIAEELDLITRTVEAFPEPFMLQTTLAKNLVATTTWAPNDPMKTFWEAVANARLLTPEDCPPAEPTLETMILLGLGPGEVGEA